MNFAEDIRSITDLKRHTREILACGNLSISGKAVYWTLVQYEWDLSGYRPPATMPSLGRMAQR